MVFLKELHGGPIAEDDRVLLIAGALARERLQIDQSSVLLVLGTHASRGISKLGASALPGGDWQFTDQSAEFGVCVFPVAFGVKVECRSLEGDMQPTSV